MQQQQHIAGSVADAMSVPGAHPTGQANGYQMDASTYAQMAAAQGLSPDQMQAQMMMMTQHGYPMDAATFAQMAALSDPTMMALGGVDPNTLAQMQAFQAAAMGMGGTAGGDYAAQAAAAGYGVPTAVPASAAASDNTSAAAGGGNGGDAGKGVGKRHAWSEEEDNVLLNAVLSLTGTRSEDWAASATPSVEQWNAITDAVPGRNKKREWGRRGPRAPSCAPLMLCLPSVTLVAPPGAPIPPRRSPPAFRLPMLIPNTHPSLLHPTPPPHPRRVPRAVVQQGEPRHSGRPLEHRRDREPVPPPRGARQQVAEDRGGDAGAHAAGVPQLLQRGDAHNHGQGCVAGFSAGSRSGSVFRLPTDAVVTADP